MEHYFACAILASLVTGSAQLEPDTRITEADVLAAIGLEHEALWESSGELDAARARAASARAFANPELGVDREAPEDQPEQWTWLLRWRPPLDGRRGLGIGAADAAADAARLHSERALIELRIEARERFAAWAIAHARAQVLARAAESLTTLLYRAEARAEIGEGSRLEARRLLLAVRALEAERAAARVDARRARAAVEALAPGVPVEALPELPPLTDPPRGEPADPLLPALRAELVSVAAEERLASRFFRFPEVSIGWQQLEDGPVTFEGPVAGIELGLPLFDRNQAQRLDAEGRRRALEARIAQREREVMSSWRSTLEVYELLRSEASSAADAAVEAGSVVAGAEAAFRLGESDLGDLLEALRAAREAELVALELRAAALESLRLLDELSAGHESEPEE